MTGAGRCPGPERDRGETRSICSRGDGLMVFVWAGIFYTLPSAAVAIGFRLVERRLNRYLETARSAGRGAPKPNADSLVP